MRTALSVLVVVAVAIALFYISRFWPFDLWTRQSWLAQIGLRPQGALLQSWLRGTSFAQFELLIWVAASFLILSWTEKLVQFICKPN